MGARPSFREEEEEDAPRQNANARRPKRQPVIPSPRQGRWSPALIINAAASPNKNATEEEKENGEIREKKNAPGSVTTIQHKPSVREHLGGHEVAHRARLASLFLSPVAHRALPPNSARRAH